MYQEGVKTWFQQATLCCEELVVHYCLPKSVLQNCEKILLSQLVNRSLEHFAQMQRAYLASFSKLRILQLPRLQILSSKVNSNCTDEEILKLRAEEIGSRREAWETDIVDHPGLTLEYGFEISHLGAVRSFVSVSVGVSSAFTEDSDDL